ncbi:MAG: hypothetical protein Q9220_005480 [cf. Caloplaca sp. 1 TL-2023]
MAGIPRSEDGLGRGQTSRVRSVEPTLPSSPNMKFETLNLLLYSSLLHLASAATCNRDNCLRALAATPTKASSFCATFTASTQTATAAIAPYASACANSPSRVSSACSCVVTAPPTCTPSTVIQGPIRNGGFDSYAIPTGPSNPKSQPPWYFDRQSNAYGDFQLEGPGSFAGEGAAAFHLKGQQPGVLPGAVAYLNAPVTFCNHVTYAFSIAARQVPDPFSNTAYQDCRLSIFSDFEGTIATFETPAFSEQFQLYGPVNRNIFRDNGVINSKGEYADTLSIIVQCIGIAGKAPVDTLFEVDSVQVTVASGQ